MPPKLLTPHELAEALDATYPDVLSWAKLGVIPSIRVAGRVYFNLSKVVKAIREPTQATDREAVAC